MKRPIYPARVDVIALVHFKTYCTARTIYRLFIDKKLYFVPARLYFLDDFQDETFIVLN